MCIAGRGRHVGRNFILPTKGILSGRYGKNYAICRSSELFNRIEHRRRERRIFVKGILATEAYPLETRNVETK